MHRKEEGRHFLKAAPGGVKSGLIPYKGAGALPLIEGFSFDPPSGPVHTSLVSRFGFALVKNQFRLVCKVLQRSESVLL